MTDSGPLRGWDPFRPLDLLAATGVAAAYKTMFVTVRQLLVGRRLSIRVDSSQAGTLDLTVTHLSSRLASGRHHDVHLEAEGISWRDFEFDRALVTLHNLHFRGNLRPTEVVAAPVELTVDVPAPALDDVFRWAAPRLAGAVGSDGIARLHLARRKGSGHVEVDARLDGSTLWVTPRAVVRRRRWSLPARTPSYRVSVPELPHGLQLTSIEFAPGIVRLTGTLPEWRADMPLSLIWPSAADTRP